jgi:hypothetical protein
MTSEETARRLALVWAILKMAKARAAWKRAEADDAHELAADCSGLLLTAEEAVEVWELVLARLNARAEGAPAIVTDR